MNYVVKETRPVKMSEIRTKKKKREKKKKQRINSDRHLKASNEHKIKQCTALLKGNLDAGYGPCGLTAR